MDLWHKTIQKDHYHWVPKGEDPFDTKWSQKRRIPNFGNWFHEGKCSRTRTTVSFYIWVDHL